MPSFKTVFTAAAVVCVASADTIKITATKDNTFDPDTVKAKSGDILEFHFEPSNHSVVSGDYRYPCSSTDVGKGFFSGYVSSSDGEAVSFGPEILSTKSLNTNSITEEDLPRNHW